jgi:hypothetical protein
MQKKKRNGGAGRSPAAPKTLELAITNDRLWARVCEALGWRFIPSV